MSAPLDFSSIGAKKPTPLAPQKKSPKRRLPGPATPKARIAAVVLVVLALAVAGFVAFGRSDISPAAQAEKLARYCTAAADFNNLVPAAPGTEPLDTSAPAMTRLMREIGGTLTRMKADAPAEIRSDVAATVTALEDAANGKPAAVRSPSFKELSQRVVAFGQSTCFGGGVDMGS